MKNVSAIIKRPYGLEEGKAEEKNTREIKRIMNNTNNIRSNKVIYHDKKIVKFEMNRKTICTIDEADYKKIKKYHCYVNYQCKIPVIRTINIREKKNLTLWRYLTGIKSKKINCEYRDKNYFNLRRKNLRVVTRSVFQHERKILRKNKTGVPGLQRVQWGRKLYQLNIMMNKKYKSYGYFRKPEDALPVRQAIIADYIKKQGEIIIK